MADDDRIVVVFPKLTPWAKRLCVWVASLWVLHALYGLLLSERLGFRPVAWLALMPDRVFEQYQGWRVVSYSLFDPTLEGSFWALLMFWWFLSPVEKRVGARKLWTLLGAAVLGGAALALLAARLAPSMRGGAAMSLGAIDGAMLAAWGILHAEEPMSLFGVVKMRGKHLAGIFVAIAVVTSLVSGSVDGMTRIGGILAGGATVFWWQRNKGAGGGGKSGGGKSSGAGARRGADAAKRFEVLRGGKDTDRSKWN